MYDAYGYVVVIAFISHTKTVFLTKTQIRIPPRESS